MKSMDKNYMLETVTNNIETDYSTNPVIYVDASTQPDGKAAIALSYPDILATQSVRISNGLLPFSAEAVAIREAIVFAKKHSVKNPVILTDALSVVNDLKTGRSKIRPKLINSIIDIIQSYPTKVCIKWIPDTYCLNIVLQIN